jgi:hypothetical protein
MLMMLGCNEPSNISLLCFDGNKAYDSEQLTMNHKSMEIAWLSVAGLI